MVQSALCLVRGGQYSKGLIVILFCEPDTPDGTFPLEDFLENVGKEEDCSKNKPWKVIGQILCLPHLKRTNQIFLPAAEPGSNSFTLVIGATGDSRYAVFH